MTVRMPIDREPTATTSLGYPAETAITWKKDAEYIAAIEADNARLDSEVKRLDAALQQYICDVKIERGARECAEQDRDKTLAELKKAKSLLEECLVYVNYVGLGKPSEERDYARRVSHAVRLAIGDLYASAIGEELKK